MRYEIYSIFSSTDNMSKQHDLPLDKPSKATISFRCVIWNDKVKLADTFYISYYIHQALPAADDNEHSSLM